MMKNFCVAVAAAFILCLPAVTYANPFGKGGHKGKCPHEAKADILACKVNHKADFYTAHAKQIGLSKEQVEKIRNLRLEFNKNRVKESADVEALKMDIMAELRQDAPDQAKINSLIDKKYSIKREMAKAAVQALLEIKGTLSPEQKEKAKELFETGKKGKFLGGKKYCPPCPKCQ